VKAFLLAAGLGTRLRPLTDHIPKCLLPIGGRTLIDIWLDALDHAGVEEVLVNVHHHAELVTAHLTARGRRPAVRITWEPQLRGSAGTLRDHREWVAGDDFFLAINADNLTDFDLRTLIDAHRATPSLATLALFHAPQPSACGIVNLDPDGVIVGFVEKPAAPTGDLANAGLYAFDPAAIDLLDGVEPNQAQLPRHAQTPIDIGFHLLPRLVGRARGVLVEGYFRDIGTPESYQHARTDWPAPSTVAAP
jgi:mannose-1-phosphate guanylyltransferase